MDHFVLDLEGPDGSSAYFTVYSLSMMQDVGTGTVALLRISTSDGIHDHCFGETTELAARMQARLRDMQSQGVAPAGTDGKPTQAMIRRSPSAERGVEWVVESADHLISASWSLPDPAFWLTAPAPAFHHKRDYATVMVGYREAELVVDGNMAEGDPYDHPLWRARLGRSFSSCHAALSETAVEAP
jgi:hypothetical protein